MLMSVVKPVDVAVLLLTSFIHRYYRKDKLSSDA